MLKIQQMLSLMAIGWSLIETNSINAQSMTTIPTNVNQLSTSYYFQRSSNLGHSSTISTDDQQTTQSSITQGFFNPPPDDGKPDRTRGAGSRQYGQCPEDRA